MNFNSTDAKQWLRMGPRAMFGQFMINIAKKNKKLMVLSADLGRSSGLARFKVEFPKQYISVGISEQNLIGVAAGLADADSNLVSWRVKRRLMSQDASGHPRALVGQCDSSFVAVHTFGCTRQPLTKAKVGPPMWSHHDDFGCLDEQHPQISTASF